MTFQEAIDIYSSYEGNYWFEDYNLELFRTKVESDLFPNRCFVSSSDFVYGDKRRYEVNQFTEDYSDINSITEPECFETLEEAIEYAKSAKSSGEKKWVPEGGNDEVFKMLMEAINK